MAGKNLFNTVKMSAPGKNVFDLSHDVKLSANMGNLVPTLCMECVPGDKVSLSCESLLRFAPLVAPMMHRVDVTMHYFFVPYRILWPNWEKYITNTKTDNVLPAFPFIHIGGGQYTELIDYMDVPMPGDGQSDSISAMPFAAYNKIWNDYYRDQNLQSEIVDQLVDGNNVANLAALTTLRKRAWEHDYFTSCLPFAQKGDPVEIPIGSQNVILNPDTVGQWQEVKKASDYTTDAATGNASISPAGALIDSALDGVVIDPKGTLITEDAGEATTINDLRTAFRLQEWLEKNARGGTRYVENILMHFGVRSSDQRMQRPEYITGTKSPVQISEVLNTTGTVDAPQGDMAGHGVSVTTGGYGRSYYCEEHGYIMGIMSVMPKTAYQQGLPKHLIKINDPMEFYWPSFAHLGEQPVLNKEIYAFQDDEEDTFGYVPRYAEYKFMSSRVAGDFRTTLDFWHMGRKFLTPPALNEAFISCDPTHRVFAVTDPEQQKLWCHIYHKIKAVRPMPKFGTPTF